MHHPAEGANDQSPRPPTSLDPRPALAIAIGGVVGAVLRWAIGEALPHDQGWPWAVFVVNIVGCVALGWLVARRAHLSDRAFAAAAIGFCGALTTFSAFAVDLAVMARDDRLGLFVGYLVASFACGAISYTAGHRIGRPHDPRVARC